MDPAPSAIAAGLADCAARAPGRVAVNDDVRALTYEELAGLVGTLARRLVEHLGPERATAPPVPLLVGRDVASLVVLLANQWAGVPSAPMDDTLPAAAVADMVERLGSPPIAVIARSDARDLVPTGVEAIEVPTTVADPVDPQVVRLDDPAGVAFTSGSTGRPKGVVYDWRFRNLDHTTEGQSARMHIAMISSFGSTAGMARAREVASGHSLAIIDPTRLDPMGLLERFDREQVTEITLVPSLVTQVVGRWPADRRLDAVRSVRTFGEALEWGHVPALRRLVHPSATIMAAYGASETSRILLMPIGPETPVGTGRVPLGRPVAPDIVRLVNVDHDPDGPAEIVVVGIVARGYLDAPELTAARFGVDDDGTRWWRSGDLARMDADGLYHHVGRVDDLVKIRGKLVEPAEPERVLHEIPSVRRAVVLPHTTERGGTRLVAHLELEPDTTLTPTTVRSRLAAELAPHLVPSPLVRHDRLPTNANGKVDRVGLRLGPIEPWRTRSNVEPRDGLERAVVTSCAEILELDTVSLDDDLWELGLDSLAAVELTAACSELGFGALEPDAPLEHPTARALAELLRTAVRRDRSVRDSTVVRLNPAGTRASIACVPGSGGTAVVYHWLARALGDEQPLVVIEPRGLHTSGRPDRTLTAAATRATDAVRAEIPEGPVTLVGYSAGGLLALETARRLHGEGRRVHVVLLDTGLPEADASGSAVQASLRATLARRLQGKSPTYVLRRAAFLLRARWLAAWPGRPRPLVARHHAFVRIAARSVRGYLPEPVAFPVTLLCTPGSSAPETWARTFVRLDVRPISGTHLSLLHPPHVVSLAQQLDEIHRAHVDGAPSDHPVPG